MKLGSLLVFLLAGMLLCVAACERPPELSSRPIITFENVEYKEVQGADSLILTIGFEDNEGDLGVSRLDQPPVIVYPTDGSGNFITFGSSDTLPAYNVCDYVINPTINGIEVEDTVYIQIDRNYYNMFLKFYRKVRGEFQEFDFRREFGTQSCFTMDGRFLRLNTQPQDRPLQGSLRYGMSSHVFGTIFRTTDTLKVQVKIRDNAFNFSEPIETPEFTLDEIKVN